MASISLTKSWKSIGDRGEDNVPKCPKTRESTYAGGNESGSCVDGMGEGWDSGVEKEPVTLGVLSRRTEPTCRAWGATDKDRTLLLL